MGVAHLPLVTVYVCVDWSKGQEPAGLTVTIFSAFQWYGPVQIDKLSQAAENKESNNEEC